MEQGEICLSLKMKVSAKCGLLPAGMSCCGRAGIKVREGAPFRGKPRQEMELGTVPFLFLSLGLRIQKVP